MEGGASKSNDSGVIKNVDFQDSRTLRLRHLRKWGQHYYIVSAPCRLSTDPKIHDLEWPFYVQFSIFTITNRVSAIKLHTYRWAIYRLFLVWPPSPHQQTCAEQNYKLLRISPKFTKLIVLLNEESERKSTWFGKLFQIGLLTIRWLKMTYKC